MTKIMKEYIDKFGKRPVILGIYRYDGDKLYENIEKAIDTNTPYSEYKLLSKKEQQAFDNDNLVF